MLFDVQKNSVRLYSKREKHVSSTQTKFRVTLKGSRTIGRGDGEKETARPQCLTTGAGGLGSTAGTSTVSSTSGKGSGFDSSDHSST